MAPAAVTVSVTSVFSVVAPDVPSTVILYLPGTVDEPTEIVMVEVPAPVTGFGLKPTLTPVGWPLALNVTGESNPPVALTVTTLVPTLPCATETAAGEAETLNAGLLAFVNVAMVSVEVSPAVGGGITSTTAVCAARLEDSRRFSSCECGGGL